MDSKVVGVLDQIPAVSIEHNGVGNDVIVVRGSLLTNNAFAFILGDVLACGTFVDFIAVLIKESEAVFKVIDIDIGAFACLWPVKIFVDLGVDVQESPPFLLVLSFRTSRHCIKDVFRNGDFQISGLGHVNRNGGSLVS